MNNVNYGYPVQQGNAAGQIGNGKPNGYWGGGNGGAVPYLSPQPQVTVTPPQFQQQTTVIPPQVSSGAVMTPSGAVVQTQNLEQSFVENILRLNLGKVGTFYMTYENNSEWNAKIFRGVLEAAGRDHIIISDPATGQRTLLLMVNLDYATFNEPLVYQGIPGAPTR
ncbi:spore coat protein GerQ [Paenibacillus agilis]|uniref:Spore coat protein GerQ n=1 Tax=Paenibacillus agilis TaxID=3020863 RepID=A0A559IXC2_9BACL|nr:spore coat protein GerQ [Paenibacillus agilis]TVX92280.1 spore coat protein GerQ [Paenibacillus agilis]